WTLLEPFPNEGLPEISTRERSGDNLYREKTDTKLYDSTQFFRCGGSIYDLSFMDVDNIHPFSNTLGWNSLKSEGRGSNEERLTVDTWQPRDEEGRSNQRNALGS
ncbi:hypothetical protein HAX54_034111, partial [Datura stramonium]|nr:hypothetical protein [Datura stramonium]